MNTNYKNLYNKYKPNGAEKFLIGGWQHHGFVTQVDLASLNPMFIIMLNQQLPGKKENHDK